MFRNMILTLGICLMGATVPALAGSMQPAPAQSTASAQTPVQVVQGIANQLSEAIDGHKQELKNNKEKLIKVIDGIFLPNFDIDYASILVLGRHARQASPEQRERFAKAFYHSITRRYAEGLLNYTRGAVKVLPARGGLDEKRTIVRTRVKLDNGKDLSVDFAFRKTRDGQWKAYDVIVEGISYISNYRNQVDAEISKEGLDGLIKRLESQGEDVMKPASTDNDDA